MVVLHAVAKAFLGFYWSRRTLFCFTLTAEENTGDFCQECTSRSIPAQLFLTHALRVRDSVDPLWMEGARAQPAHAGKIPRRAQNSQFHSRVDSADP